MCVNCVEARLRELGLYEVSFMDLPFGTVDLHEMFTHSGPVQLPLFESEGSNLPTVDWELAPFDWTINLPNCKQE